MSPLQAAAGAPAPSWLPAVIGLIIALGGGGGLAALLRSRADGSRIVVDAAQGAVIVQSGVIGDLRGQIAELRAQLAEISTLRGRVRELEHDNELLRADNARLTAQVRELERRTP